MVKAEIETLRRKLQESKAKIDKLEGQMEDRIIEHPLQSIAIAFGIGVVSGALLASLMRRRGDIY